VEGDTLLHAVLRNAHLTNRQAMVTVLLEAGADPNAMSSDGRRPFELDLQGKRHTWRREHADHLSRRAGVEMRLASFAGMSGV
jgi:ankyrin repeat protein